MESIFKKIKNEVKYSVEKISETTDAFVNHEKTKGVIDWSKNNATVVAEEVSALGKRAIKSEMAKDAATGAGIGAAIAVPIPLVGPAFGAVVGAGIGVIVNLKKNNVNEVVGDSNVHKKHTAEEIADQLIKLDELRQKNILTDDEFQQKKKEILERF